MAMIKKSWADWSIAVHDDNNICGFFGEFRYLSNFHSCDVEYLGVLYPSSENAYMAAKCANVENRKMFLNILPKEAKALGRTVKLRPDWESVKTVIMFNILLSKFRLNKDLRKLLLSTGQKKLEETNYWGDTYWGVCNGVGSNYLGNLLMIVRDIAQKTIE